ncbi:nuclease-related domain-containing protein [Pseudonocardia spinosispora]|uniref:nuclease-related domain-containing protein n=1 Tax=Pseudonocardia spinosispora TaxID=103441 RepID=UPI00040DEE89|nr:nuclease-related domain-containing protein [Pseudonocardia spinosispora]
MGDAPWRDLVLNVAGGQVVREANRRHRVDGPGADWSWRVGAEGEHLVADALIGLVRPSRLDRLRHRTPGWWVLHSVPTGDGGSDIDHLLGGPGGVVTINTKHHRGRRVLIEGDAVIVDRRRTEYVARARTEAEDAARLLRRALARNGRTSVAEHLVVRPMVAVVGARVLDSGRPGGVIVTNSASLEMCLRALPSRLTRDEVASVFEVARRSTTWQGHQPEPRESWGVPTMFRSPDFALLDPDGSLSYEQCRPGEALEDAVRRHLKGDPRTTARFPLGSDADHTGPLEVWHREPFTADMADNELADRVLGALSPQVAAGWAGPVAISMRAGSSGGHAPPLTADVCAVLDQARASASRNRV